MRRIREEGDLRDPFYSNWDSSPYTPIASNTIDRGPILTIEHLASAIVQNLLPNNGEDTTSIGLSDAISRFLDEPLQMEEYIGHHYRLLTQDIQSFKDGTAHINDLLALNNLIKGIIKYAVHILKISPLEDTDRIAAQVIANIRKMIVQIEN